MTDWLLANPKAGDGERNADFWKEHLASSGLTDIRDCDLNDLSWLEKLVAGDRIFAAGGDGSVNKAAELCVNHKATLAVLPSGTANDFHRNLGMPDDPEALCEKMWVSDEQQVDVAEHEHGIYLNVAHVGLGTLPSRDAEGQGKRLFGRFSYGLALARRLFSKQGFHATIFTDEARISGRWLTIAVANGAFFGGGTEIPHASLSSGKLVILGIRPASLPSLLAAFVATRLKRDPPNAKTVVELSSASCQIVTRRPKTVTVDGDVAGKTPFTATCKPGVLRVVADQIWGSDESNSG